MEDPEQHKDCPHGQFLIRIKDGYACLVCKQHLPFDENDLSKEAPNGDV